MQTPEQPEYYSKQWWQLIHFMSLVSMEQLSWNSSEAVSHSAPRHNTRHLHCFPAVSCIVCTRCARRISVPHVRLGRDAAPTVSQVTAEELFKASKWSLNARENPATFGFIAPESKQFMIMFSTQLKPHQKLQKKMHQTVVDLLWKLTCCMLVTTCKHS